MARVQANVINVGLVQYRTVLQLLFCHCLVFIMALLSGAHILPILGACLLSLLLMCNIPYDLYLLEIMLERLTRSLPVEPISLRLHWSLARLFVLVNVLSKQTGLQVQREQRNVEYRDQLLQQVSKTAAQEERNRLARDLHDSIKQQLFSIAVSAAAIKARWKNNPISTRKIVDDIERIAQEAQVEMQALLQQLRPTALENVGLIESLRMQCQALSYRIGAEVVVELGDLPPDEQLPIGTQEMIFRIVQEGFANIARHARATQVWLSLRWQKNVLLVEIGDYGQGFDLAKANEYFLSDCLSAGRPRASTQCVGSRNKEYTNTYGGMGLSNVRERVRALGGTVAIWSLPDKGTTLHVCIPLLEPQEQVQEKEIASREAVKAQVRRLLQQMVIDWMAWGLIVGLMPILLSFFPFGLAESIAQDMGFILLCVWFLIILVKSVRVARWLSVRPVGAGRAIQDWKEGDV